MRSKANEAAELLLRALLAKHPLSEFTIRQKARELRITDEALKAAQLSLGIQVVDGHWTLPRPEGT